MDKTEKAEDNGQDIEDISEEIKEKPKKKNKKEEQDTSVQQFRRNKKHGWIKWVVIGLAVAGIIAFFVFRSINAAKKIAESMNQVQTDEIKRMDLSKAISTTGTIQSKDVRTITSALAGVKIDEVNCKVGDMVQKGDVVVTFSREDINKKIGQIEEDIQEAKQVKGLDSGDRVNTYNNSNGIDFYNVASAYDKVKKAETDLQKAKDAVQRVCDEKAAFRDLHNEAVDKYTSVEKDYIEAKQKYETFLAQDNKDEAARYASEVDRLSAKLSTYRSAMGDSYNDKITSFEEQEKTKFDARDQAQRDYDAAIVAYNKANYDAYYNGEKSDYSLTKGNVQANDNIKTLERQKEQNEDSLDNYIVTAPIAGLVTAVNAQEGNGYQATTGALLTIQAVDVLEVTTQVDEYDINNVKIGQSVAIMTDATGEDELTGIVTFIAPTATAAQSGTNATATSTSSSSSFEVKIDIQNKDDRLRLGMSAKLNILVDTHKNVLAVPYDAIEEEEGGAKCIYVMDKNAPADTAKPASGGIEVIGVDGTTTTTPVPSGKPDKPSGMTDKPSAAPAGAKKIPVQIGLEGDYYTEVISPDIKEGMTVVVNSTAGEIKNDMGMFPGM